MSLLNYLQSTKAELKHINWPTQKEAILYTIAVVVVALGVGAYLGALDFIFITLLEMFIL
ncbi:MAG: preprotein translocase subunit SecE [Patescibacteria group bacterium]|jgi:preprotein translocase SecE subunit|nr:preprotein translocase subunit SecE [Patescibacteria group bacterium]